MHYITLQRSETHIKNCNLSFSYKILLNLENLFQSLYRYLAFAIIEKCLQSSSKKTSFNCKDQIAQVVEQTGHRVKPQKEIFFSREKIKIKITVKTFRK